MNNSTIEKWQPINLEGNEGKYAISTLGRVYNTHANKFVSHVVTGVPQYFYVNLYLKNGHKLRRVHNLMARTFLPNNSTYKYVDHKDRNRFNNSLSNLRWVTSKENMDNRKDSVSIEGVPFQKYLDKNIKDKGIRKSVRNYLYQHKLYSKEDMEKAVKYFTKRGDIIEQGKRETKLKKLMARKFNSSIEFNSMWFPSTKVLCEHYELRESSFKNYHSQGLSDNMVIQMSKQKWGLNKVYEHKGEVGTIEYLISVFNPTISEPTFHDRRRNLKWTFEESLEIPVKSLRHYYYKGQKYKLVDLCNLLGININSVRKKVSGYSYSFKQYCKDRNIEEWKDIELP